jgi:hypothetical protein
MKDFRSWVMNKYYINREERNIFKEDEISFDEYVRKNKWWLKEEFKKEKMNDGNKNKFGARFII